MTTPQIPSPQIVHSKITSQHLAKKAYVYIRQSTLGQVLHHQESTIRQYALREKALTLGWSESGIRVLDRDLGQSGSQSHNRQDFRTLLADVSLGEVGAVLALEASRLARSNTDWYRLIELCSLTGTLLLDEDGCYDPADFNDALLLGLKGTMSAAELHFLRGRLQGGKRNKAQRGELRFPVPVGLCWHDDGQIVLDPDAEVQGAVILQDGEIRHRVKKMSRDSWLVEIQNHHEGYLTWERYLENQDRLQRNLTHQPEMALAGPVREGLALLHGLLICGKCGRRLTVRYRGNGGIYPIYECNWLKRQGRAKRSCLSLQCPVLDQAVAARVLQVLNAQNVELALAAHDELEKRDEAVIRQWQMRLGRAGYEAQLAQRRYEEVDPANRLVAATLEHRWNETLQRVDEVQRQMTEFQHRKTRTFTTGQRERIQSLAADIPRLWKSQSTLARDRKRILRLLLEDITVERCDEPRQALLHARWTGGACEDLAVPLPAKIADRLRYPAEFIERVRCLAAEYSDTEIAVRLNQAGQLSAQGKPFTASMIAWIRYKHGIPAPVRQRPEELTVPQVAQKFRVSHHVVYYWIDRGIIPARQDRFNQPYWITLTQDQESELHRRVQNSNRIRSINPTIPNVH